jgi:hypothetical protein
MSRTAYHRTSDVGRRAGRDYRGHRRGLFDASFQPRGMSDRPTFGALGIVERGVESEGASKHRLRAVSIPAKDASFYPAPSGHD